MRDFRRIIKLSILFITGCNYNNYCDYKLPQGYKICKNEYSEYAIRNNNGGLLSYSSRYSTYDFDGEEGIISSKDSCYVKYRFSEYIKWKSKRTFN